MTGQSLSIVPRLAGRGWWLFERLAGLIEAEAGRLPLVWPLWFAGGVGLYFILNDEPPLWLAALSGSVGLALLIARHRLRGAMAAGLFLAGFALVTVRCFLIATPMLTTATAAAPHQGTVLQLDHLSYGTRLVLELEDGLKVRVTAPKDLLPASLAVGDRLEAPIRLAPITAPFTPGGYDLQRQLYFQGIGGIGWIEGPAKHDPQMAASWRVALERFRAELQQAIHQALPEREAAVAAALVVGEQGAIAEEDAKAMRTSGLSHLLSISGLHIGLVAWLFLGGLSALLSLVPALVLRWPARKIAAYPALAAIFFYALLAGWDIPVQRSFLMYALVLLALMVNRDPWSLRSVALAAFAVLVVTPEALLSPGFQMSFAAVLVLIAGWERVQPRLLALREAGGWPYVAGSWLLGTVASSVLATLATTPFALHHFQQPSPYGILANMIAIPLSGIVIMPAAVLAIFGMVVGWPEPGFALLGWGIDLLLDLAAGVADLPGANLLLPALPTGPLLLIVAGGIWLALSVTNLRWVGLGSILLGLLLYTQVPKPLGMVSANGRAIAVAGEGKLQVAGVGRTSIQARAWGERALTRSIDPVSCGAVCFLKTEGFTLALVRAGQGVRPACREADIVMTLVPLRQACPGPTLVRDIYDADRDGAITIYRERAGFRLDPDRDHRGRRPWVVRSAS